MIHNYTKTHNQTHKTHTHTHQCCRATKKYGHTWKEIEVGIKQPQYSHMHRTGYTYQTVRKTQVGTELDLRLKHPWRCTRRHMPSQKNTNPRNKWTIYEQGVHTRTNHIHTHAHAHQPWKYTKHTEHTHPTGLDPHVSSPCGMYLPTQGRSHLSHRLSVLGAGKTEIQLEPHSSFAAGLFRFFPPLPLHFLPLQFIVHQLPTAPQPVGAWLPLLGEPSLVHCTSLDSKHFVCGRSAEGNMQWKGELRGRMLIFPWFQEPYGRRRTLI